MVTYNVEVRNTQIRRAFLSVTLTDEPGPSPGAIERAKIFAELWDYEHNPVDFGEPITNESVRPQDGEVILAE